jgi:hypothetical protein
MCYVNVIGRLVVYRTKVSQLGLDVLPSLLDLLCTLHKGTKDIRLDLDLVQLTWCKCLLIQDGCEAVPNDHESVSHISTSIRRCR